VLKATHSNHPNQLLPLHFVRLKLIAWVHGPMIENMVEKMQEKFAK